ncbi:MAG: T9SS type A sorting domain-containing protein [Bacteroidales bacterium]
MNKPLSLLIGFLVFNLVLPLGAQDLIKNSSVTGVCYAGKKVSRFYIPPPAEFFRSGRSRAVGSITVNYTGFSSQAKSAMDYAISILEKTLPADTRIIVNASWEKISTSGILAQSTITGYVGGSVINALNPLAFYPFALADKIAGKSLSDSLQGDISLAVNSSINWYMGTDGQTPTQKYDLVTVILHEMCHGLGFFDSFSSDGTLGSYGIGSVPMIYDTFVENYDGNRLTDTMKFRNYSTALESQLIGNQLYFNGPLLKKYSTSVNYLNLRAKLYAPSTWDPGSSISHLDESATLRVNSLMTPFIDLGEAIHDPGKYTFSILGDLGWINTRIIHTPIGDTEDHLSQVLLSVMIKSDTTYDHNKVGVVYSFNNFLTSDTLYLGSEGANDTYNIAVNIPGYNTELQYYFFVEDYFLRTYRSPSVYKDYPIIKNNRYHVFIGTDTVKPVISHTPVTYYLQAVDSIKYLATATDNLGIDSVYVEFKVNQGPSKFYRMKKGAQDSYSTSFDARSLLLKGHDTIEYRLFAVDTARIPNVGVLPKTGFFVAPVEEILSTLSTYSTDFSDATPDFFNIGFDITKPSGFSKYGLNTKHPYESPEDNNKSIEYTSILRHPLKLDESGLLVSYNEVVLVEPGEEGSVYGSPDFYDYVIVEGSKNFGKTWFALIDGYDSRLFPSWLSAYNSSIVGDNSTYIGSEALLQKHTFLYRPSDKISAGDTLLLRFRLFSDPFANGWGWVVEDLKINPLIDIVSEMNNHPVMVYPNPGTGLIKISTDITGSANYKPLHYSVFNIAGICLRNATTSGSSETLIDISSYPAGIYIIILYLDDGLKTIKYSLIK